MAEPSINDKAGHRQRVRERFKHDDGSSMADYELLEFLLMLALPRRDVKPIAKELLRHFGSFADVIYAPDNELMEIKWVKENTCTIFHLIAAAVKRVCQYRLQDNNTISLSTIDAVIDYCRAIMAYEEVEKLQVIFLDASYHVISSDIIQKGSLTEVAISPREIIRMAIDKKAVSIILIHNHPSDNVRPSDNDIFVTGRIEEACEVLDIKLRDHIIIGKSNYFSFREHHMLMK